MSLTSRQRLSRLFQGKDIDRVPIWLLAPYHPLVYYADIYRLACYRPVVSAIDQWCDTFDRRRPDLGVAYNALARRVPFREGNRTGERIICGTRVLERYAERGNGGSRLKYFVDDPEQLKEILAWPFELPLPPLSALRQEAAELGERGLFMLDLGDPLEPLYHLCDPADFSMWTLTDPETLFAFTDAMMDRALRVYRYFLENNVGDAFFIVGAEFAGPPLVSPRMFMELSGRYVKAIVDLIRSFGKIAIVHYHGNLFKVLEGFRRIAPDGLHTVEAPPIGDCTLEQARAALGRETTLIGNIQYDDLARKTPEEIDAQVCQAIRQGASGRFILSPTAGPYESAPTPRTLENYLAFIRAGVRYGRANG